MCELWIQNATEWRRNRRHFNVWMQMLVARFIVLLQIKREKRIDIENREYFYFHFFFSWLFFVSFLLLSRNIHISIPSIQRIVASNMEKERRTDDSEKHLFSKPQFSLLSPFVATLWKLHFMHCMTINFCFDFFRNIFVRFFSFSVLSFFRIFSFANWIYNSCTLSSNNGLFCDIACASFSFLFAKCRMTKCETKQHENSFLYSLSKFIAVGSLHFIVSLYVYVHHYWRSRLPESGQTKTKIVESKNEMMNESTDFCTKKAVKKSNEESKHWLDSIFSFEKEETNKKYKHFQWFQWSTAIVE